MANLVCKTIEELNRAKEILINSPVVAYDTETTGLKFKKSKVFMHSLSNGIDSFAFRNQYFTEEQIQNFLRPILNEPLKLILGQNLKFDRHMLRETHGIEITSRMEDTMLMSHLMDENSTTSLKPRVQKVLGFSLEGKEGIDAWMEDKWGKDKAKWDFSQVPEGIMDPYSCDDAWFTWKLHEHYKHQIAKHFPTLYATNMKVWDILYRMERTGIPVDVPYMINFKAILDQRMSLNSLEIYNNFGAIFNLDSPLEVAEVLYQKMKLPIPRVVDAKEGSTGDQALRQIDHPVARGIQEHRRMAKLLGSYVIPLLEQQVGGMLYPDYTMTRTKTGRFSCSDPNMQAVTKDEEYRRGFIVEPGEEMWFWDQSQIEMVGFAMYSKDPKMMAAIQEGADLHMRTAMEVLDKQEVDGEERAMGKGTNFAVVYGVGKAKLASYLSGYVGRQVEDAKAAEFKARYLNAFPSVYQFQQQVMQTVKTHREPWGNFVKNKFSRVRRITSDKAYTGVNHLIQGWASDLMRHCMVLVDEKYKPKWVQNIHDANRIDFPIGTKMDIIKDIGNLFCDSSTVGLPIRCTIERSQTNWAEVEKVK